MPHTLRPATQDDSDAIAALHLAVWRATYGHLAPPQAVARLDLAHRQAQWRAALGQGGAGALVAEGAAGLSGVVAFGPAPFPPFDGRAEIRHLYVTPEARGAGLGRRLLSAAFDALAAKGERAVALAVVAENHPARAFYRAMGGHEEGAFTDKGPLWRSKNVLVVWSLPA